MGHARHIRRSRPRPPKAQPLANVIQPKRIRQRSPIATRLRCVMRLNRHVKLPARDEQPEDPIRIARQRHQHREHNQVHDPLRILLVVHCAHARDQSQQSCQSGVRPGRRRRHPRPARPRIHRVVTPRTAPARRASRRPWHRATRQPRCEARLAIHRRTNNPYAFVAESLPAILAEAHRLLRVPRTSHARVPDALILFIHAVHATPHFVLFPTTITLRQALSSVSMYSEVPIGASRLLIPGPTGNAF